MSIKNLTEWLAEVRQTPEYQFENLVVDITEDICEIMEAKGMSRADLARELGKSRAWVTKVLRGDQNLTLKTVVDVFWSLGYKLNMKSELANWRAGWTQSATAYESQSTITVRSPRKAVDDTARYTEEPIGQAPEVANVDSVAA